VTLDRLGTIKALIKGMNNNNINQNKENIMITGQQEYESARDAVAEAQGNYDAAGAYGYPYRESQALKQAQETYDAVCTQYPAAAAWGKAQGWTYASNDCKVTAGKRAVARIEAGEDHEVVIAEMESEWSAAALSAVQNS